MNNPNICIIGGGIAGLSVAAQLAAGGLQPLVLEAHATALGGRLRDEPALQLEHAGREWSFPCEHGVHGIWKPYVNFTALLEKHGIQPDLQPSLEEMWVYMQPQRVRMAAIGSAMRRSPIPPPFHYLWLFLRPRFLAMLNPHDLLALFLVQGRLTSALAIDPLAEGKSLEGMSLADFMSGWSPALRSLFAGLARNALAAHPEHAPAAGFIAFLRFYTLMRRDAWEFQYMQGTGGKLISEPLAARASALGSQIKLGCRATRLEPEGQQWRVVYDDEHDKQEQSLIADRVVLALDAPAAQQLLLASPALAEQAARLRFPKGVATAIIRAFFSSTARTKAESGICTGDVLVDNFFWLHELQPAYREWHQATGGSAVELHIYDPPETSDDAVLLARALGDITRAFPELRGQLLQSSIQHNPATHTLFTPGDPLTSLNVQTGWPGILACGDWVAHPNPALYLERAVTTGILAANLLLEEQGLASWPVLSHPAPEGLAAMLAPRLQRFRQEQVTKKRSTR